MPTTSTVLGDELSLLEMGRTIADVGSSSHTRTGYPSMSLEQSPTRMGRWERSASANGH